MAPRDHDAIYRRLFRHRSLVEDLIRRFVGGRWVEQLDFDTLELMPSHYVSDELRGREDDRVWRLRIKAADGADDESSRPWFYIYVVLEFQSTNDATMALRLLVYLGLLYQDIARELERGEKLPPVLPVVLYNGKRPWTAPRRLQDLVEAAPAELAPYQPRFAYLLFDETRHPADDLQAEDSPVSAVFRLEQASQPDELAREIGRIVELVESSRDFEGLRQEFTIWLKRVILPKRFPGASIDAIHDLEELKTMLEETVDGWTREWRTEGARRMLLGLLVKRFGELPKVRVEQVESATADDMERWSDRLLDASDLDAIFA
ncbi:MAG: Rpn family recombination-promoting nuclease/putative transposase [Acidobacteriota bacterium]